MKSLAPKRRLQQTFAVEGIGYAITAASAAEKRDPMGALDVADQPLARYLAQLVIEGITSNDADTTLIPWDGIYQLLVDEAHSDSIGLLKLPLLSDRVPIIETRGALSDPSFQFILAGWWSPTSGKAIPVRCGALLRFGQREELMLGTCWNLVKQVTRFAAECAAMDSAARLHAVGRLKTAALACGARLDDFLTKTGISTPDRLQIDMRREEALDQPVFEIIPRLEGTPPRFVEAFDRFLSVQKRYDIVMSDGALVHVAPGPGVRAALGDIKDMPGRRLSAEQAALIAYNPHAVFGEEAASALDDEQFAQARAEVGLVPSRLRVAVDACTASLATVEILPVTDDAEPERLQLNATQVQQLLAAAGRSRARQLPIFSWQGNEILLDAVTEHELAALAAWRAHAEAAPPGIRKDELLDLTAYSARVTGFDAKVQAVPYVAHQAQDHKWLPDDDLGIVSVDTQTGVVKKHPMSPEALESFRQCLDDAVANGASTVRIPGSDTEVTISQARELVSELGAIGLGVGRQTDPRPVTDPKPNQHVGLRIFHNIEALDYVEAIQQMVGDVRAEDVELPNALRRSIALLPHQVHGLAWLQRRYLGHGNGISGCLLADDMGLGKTLQCLALVAWAAERCNTPKPSLVVAPVSLLDNWKQEIEKFLDWSQDTVLSLYGPELTRLRASPASIDPELKTLGVRKLLRPGFAEGYRLVLTTYETLRDYQLSLARQAWNVVVCDEAQKVKNPAAFVTQAVKALRATFKVACTGTPVENSLADLWCLFDFFQPGCLGALNEFTRIYRNSIERRLDGHESLIDKLRARIDPWVLRRLKTDIAKDLPRKLTGEAADPGAAALPMSPEQTRAYATIIAEFRAQARNDGDARRSLLPLLHRLRMICAYPMGALRADPEQASVAEHLRASPKLAWMIQKLRVIAERGEKAIVFTDYRPIQRIIQRAVEDHFRFRPHIINGATTADANSDHSRQKLIDAFQQAPGFGVMILGTTAVGFGVNIQHANHVIHFTRSWNPAREDQATDRAYRIGQTRDVYVYCPTVVGNGFESFEQRLAERLDGKRALSADMLQGPQEISIEDFRDL